MTDFKHLRELEEKATPGEWYVQDFTDPVLGGDPTAGDVTVSCSWPDHIGVASMCGGLDGHKGLQQARNDAAFISAARREVLSLLTTLDEARGEAVKALIKARNGLSDGVNQYASRDFGGAIIPGDEQYPWVRSMQIGLDAVHQALEVKP